MVYDRGRSVDYVGWFLNENILHRFISSLGHFVRLIRNASFQLHIAHSVTSAQNSRGSLHNVCDEFCPSTACSFTSVSSDVFSNALLCNMVGMFSRCKFPGGKKIKQYSGFFIIYERKLTTSKLSLLALSVNHIML